MNITDLTINESTAFAAGRAEACAVRWSIDADMAEQEGKDGSQRRRYQREYEAERDRLLAILNERKEAE